MIPCPVGNSPSLLSPEDFPFAAHKGSKTMKVAYVLSSNMSATIRLATMILP